MAGGLLLAGRSAGGAVSLPSLGGATVQTLIDRGSDGVTVGDARYFDFTYAGSIDAPAASAVRVQSAPGDDGLRFVAGWVAAGGSWVSGTVGYDVAPVDQTSAIVAVALSSDGTAPSPGTGTFATATLAATNGTTGVRAAPLLTTFDDGAGPAADVDQSRVALVDPTAGLSVTSTVTAASSGASPAGVATASVVENQFTVVTPVPEPTAAAALAVGTALGAGRRGRRKP